MDRTALGLLADAYDTNDVRFVAGFDKYDEIGSEDLKEYLTDLGTSRECHRARLSCWHVQGNHP